MVPLSVPYGTSLQFLRLRLDDLDDGSFPTIGPSRFQCHTDTRTLEQLDHIARVFSVFKRPLAAVEWDAADVATEKAPRTISHPPMTAVGGW